MSQLHRMLVDQDPKLLSTYMLGIKKLLVALYSQSLDTTLMTQLDTPDLQKQLFVFLTVLNREDALQRYILDQDPDHHKKLKQFLSSLQRITENELLTFTCTETEYIQRCINEWIIA